MKKSYRERGFTGIWIDQEKAYLVHFPPGGSPSVEMMVSGVESRVRFPGEGKKVARFGQAFLDNQETQQRRQHQQRLRFFRKVIDAVSGDDYIFIMGPGPARERLHKGMLRKNGFENRIVAVEPADRMSRAQLLEKMRNYIVSPEFKTWKKAVRKMHLV